ncbi:MAG: peroxiredoxin [Deltaproteobacteria bacterium]|nr:peroxiredoxin [Deltaproteobacteria bacterium]
MPAVGLPAPDFTLPADDGTLVTLSALRGRPVVVYFYPRDDTPGCTVEACDFRDRNDAWARQLGAIVLGISADGAPAHQRFRKKYGLNFPLLTDATKDVMRAYGAFGRKVMYGKEIEGILRSTFLVDSAGILVRAWPKVAVKGHADEVLAALRQLPR